MRSFKLITTLLTHALKVKSGLSGLARPNQSAIARLGGPVVPSDPYMWVRPSLSRRLTSSMLNGVVLSYESTLGASP